MMVTQWEGDGIVRCTAPEGGDALNAPGSIEEPGLRKFKNVS
jgi:hypothetical protein